MTTVKIRSVEGPVLYCRYPNQSSPQGCYVELDCGTGELLADYNAEIGSGVPFAVFYGLCQRWDIPALRSRPANALLAVLAEDAQIVLDGFDPRWDGSNWIAAFTDAAEAARARIARACEDAYEMHEDCIQVWDAREWFCGASGVDPLGWADEWNIAPTTTDEDIAVLYDTVLDAEDADVLEGLADFLAACRAAVQERALLLQHPCGSCGEVEVYWDRHACEPGVVATCDCTDRPWDVSAVAGEV